MAAVGSSSYTYNFQLGNADVVLEAFERAKIRSSAITSQHMISARRSLNLELQTWSNRGPNLPYIYLYTLPLIVGTASYQLPPNTISVLDVYYSVPNTGATGTTTDRVLEPISRDDYAAFPNKSTQSNPTVYWFDRLNYPTITFYQTPAYNYNINMYLMRRVQDANVGSGETPDVNYRFQDALCAGLAARLAEKFSDPQTELKLRAVAQKAWQEASAEDREQSPQFWRPVLSSYWR
jgi:hypothetical protein